MRTSLYLLLVAAACGTDVSTSTSNSPDAGNGSASADTLISGAWSLDAMSEKYVCVRQTVTRDIYISQISPIAPLGTHHSVLMVGPPDAPDGTTDCTSSLVKPSVYASGVGTQPFTFPSGVALHLHPGDQLLLNLHLFNSGGSTLMGTSGMTLVETTAADVQHEAGVVLAGKAQGLVVPVGTSTQTGTCTTTAGSTLFALAPHMHLLGTHMKVTYGSTVLLDQDYQFDAQRYNMITPMMPTTTGGKYTVDCTYTNETGAPVSFGESTTNEMCFALTFVYPPPATPECTR
jgi:hypothetical protein